MKEDNVGPAEAAEDRPDEDAHLVALVDEALADEAKTKIVCPVCGLGVCFHNLPYTEVPA